MSGSGGPGNSPPDMTASAVIEKIRMAGFAARFFKPNKVKTAPEVRIRWAPVVSGCSFIP